MSGGPNGLRYCWWPRPPLQAVSAGDHATFSRSIVAATLVAAALCLPVVREATGIAPRWSVGLMAAHVVWSAFVVFVLTKPGEGFRSRRAIDVGMAGNLFVNTGICIALCVFSRDPRTPLWMLPTLYATMNGSLPEGQPSAAILGVHILAPLATIPIFRSAEVVTGWSVAGPVLCAAISAAGYHTVAIATARWRRVRAEQEQVVAELRARLAERDRGRLAQDLHDSVGSVLGVVGLYGDLVERNCDRPDELRAIAAMMREATKEGLTDLRSVIGALAPASTDVSGVARALRPIARRVSEASGVDVSLAVAGPGDLAIDGPARLTLVRVFQEALNNAIKHGRPSHVRVELKADRERISLEVSDDGEGFTAGARERPDGRGLRGMRERVEELGGSFILESAPGRGTRVRATMPRTAPS